MTEREVEQRLGYTPCICGALNGTWHRECYVGKTQEQIDAAYKKTIAKARKLIRFLEQKP